MALVIGVSAHRNIKPEAAPQLSSAVKTVLTEILRLRGNNDIVTLNGLAEGGDMLCGQVACELGIKTIVALPTTKEEYLSTDFSDEGITRFERLQTAQNVVKTIIAPDAEVRNKFGSAQEIKDYRFRQQSLFVATRSDILLALWDGTHSDMNVSECGTAFAVRAALEGKRDGAVIAVFAPREGKSYARQPNKIRYLLSGKTHGDYDEYVEMPERLKTIIINH